MTEDQARQLFFDHCQPCGRGALERYGERPAVAAILAALSPEAPAREGVVKACADFQEAIDYFEADVADALAEDSERADLWDREVTVNIDALKTVMRAALTPRHEAPASRPELAPYTEDLKGIKASMLADEAPAEEAGEALRTALIKARSELAIQYCYSAGRMGIAGCYPELAEKYGGSAIVQEIDAVLALTPRHEAPAREGVALDKRIADAAERDRRERDKAFRGESYEPLTPTHEAPADHHEGNLTASNAELIEQALSHPPHESPAEGAGEAMTEREVRQWIDACNHEPARQVLRDYLALRACSSAPEARKEALGNLLAVIHGDGGHRALEVGTKQAALEAEKIVANLLSSAPEAREGEAVAGAKALAFFKWARDFFWCEDGCEIDGGDFQDAAERFGLIVKVPFDPERHADNGYGLEDGDDWYETEPAVEHALSTTGALKGDAK